MKYSIILSLCLLVSMTYCTGTKIIDFNTDRSCNYSLFSDSKYHILMRGCMDEWPMIFIYEKGHKIDEIRMPPGFSGIKECKDDTIYAFFNESMEMAIDYCQRYKGQFNLIPILSEPPESEKYIGGPLIYIKAYKKMNYEPTYQEVVVVNDHDSTIRYSVSEMYFEGAAMCNKKIVNSVIIVAVYEMEVSDCKNLMRAIIQGKAVSIPPPHSFKPIPGRI